MRGYRIFLYARNTVCRDGVSEASHTNLPALLAFDLIVDMREGLVGDQNLARLSFVLEARGKVHCSTDDRVVHTVLAAEVTNGAVSGMHADAASERRLDSRCAPHLRQLLPS